MDELRKRPALWWGAVVAGLLSLPLMALFFLGERLAGLPFLPLDFFTWLAQNLPGGLLTFGIDTMVDTLIAMGLGSDLDSAAKIAEQGMGLGLFLGIGILAGFVFFLIVQRSNWERRDTLLGGIFGLAMGIPLALFSLNANVSSSAPELMQWVWVLLLFIGYGAALNWAYNEMAYPAIPTKENAVSVEGIDRRNFIIRLGGASATLSLVGAGLGTFLGETTSEPSRGGEENLAASNTNTMPENLPNADSAVTPAPGTRSEITPVDEHYRIDILAAGLPNIPADYTLPIFGLVANPVEWTLDEIKAMPSTSEYITMSCISNRVGGSLISTVKWTGVSFQHLLEQVQPSEDARAIKITGYDGFDEYIELDLIRNDPRIMLAYAFDDADLPLRNGYPLRTHIPNHYGMKQPKWIQAMEFVDAWEEGYWVRRGWSRNAIVNATSVVDTVATNDVFTVGDQSFVPIGGMAWAGDRGIVRVEVQVDGGDWKEAQIREAISDRTWVLWRYDWPFVEGNHSFAVRSYETPAEGQSDPVLQPTDSRGTRPDGATGIHAVSVMVLPSDTDA
jgi:DMSO/TMAO reductase YedYZ molybdopterin-dependent catalytic subunit